MEGRRVDGYTAFWGIPYAASPTGPLWLREPQREAPWNGVRPAVAPGPTAPQRRSRVRLAPEQHVAGPDYLNVNVFTPASAPAKLPVLVWIHGGGFIAGTPHSVWHDPGAFMADGVVLVTITYRLGLEGLLAVPGRPDNRAVLDWLAALRWVQECIGGFGGDPGNVTIAGQSAGSEACLVLHSLPSAPNLFGRVIAMSGSLPSAGEIGDPDARSEKVAHLLGIDRNGLAGVAPEQLLAVQAKVTSMTGSPGRSSLVDSLADKSSYLRPHVDGAVVQRLPLDAVRDGAGADVDVVIGSTSEEMNAAARFATRWPKAATFQRAFTNLGLTPEQTALYTSSMPGSKRHQILGQAMTDRTFRSGVARVAEARVAAGGTTYCYEFRWRSPALFGRLGAVHCVDVPFAFGSVGLPKSGGMTKGGPAALVNDVHGALARFVTGGDPGWPAYERPARLVRVFDEPSGVENDPLRLVRSLWP